MTKELSRKLMVSVIIAAFIFAALAPARAVQKVRMAYISDSPGSSAPYWIAKDAGLFKKYGLDVELVFINGSTRGIQSLVAGDIEFGCPTTLSETRRSNPQRISKVEL